MASVTNCVCGASVSRSKGKYYHHARNGRRSGRMKRLLGSNTQLCSSCMSNFIGSRPSKDKPDEPGTHLLCDFCNAQISNWEWLKLAVLRPKITRWVGKVPNWRGETQTVCTDCHDALQDYVEEKKNA